LSTTIAPALISNTRTEILEQIRGEDFEIEYNSKNSFRFMGNGMTAREEKNEDLAFYVYK
jgi:hypothetical protein